MLYIIRQIVIIISGSNGSCIRSLFLIMNWIVHLSNLYIYCTDTNILKTNNASSRGESGLNFTMPKTIIPQSRLNVWQTTRNYEEMRGRKARIQIN